MKLLKDKRRYDYVGVIGDLHLEFNPILHFFEKTQLTNICLICVGDFCVGTGAGTKEDTVDKQLIHNQRVIARLNSFFRSKKSILYVVRGNHDNPFHFDGLHDLSNIKYVVDYTVLQIHDRRIFCLGGGTSIDRKVRTSASYWPEERINIDVDRIEALNIDTMITHIAPLGIFPFHYDSIVDLYANDKLDEKGSLIRSGDYQLKTDLHLERHLLRNFILELKEKNPTLNKLFYGHYHRSYIDELENINCKLLAIGEIVDL